MSNIDTINVGGLDYSIEDSTAREEAASAITVSAYVENGNTASRAYSVLGTPVNWKGSLYYTTATIAQGATLSSSNLTAATNLGQLFLTRTNNIRTYVGTDSKLHFRDATGADSVLPFNANSVKDAINALCPFYLIYHSGSNQSSATSDTVILPLKELAAINVTIGGYTHHGSTFTLYTLNAAGGAVASQSKSMYRDTGVYSYSLNANGAVKFSATVNVVTDGGSTGGHNAWVRIDSVS